jgi:hypothetical protein
MAVGARRAYRGRGGVRERGVHPGDGGPGDSPLVVVPAEAIVSLVRELLGEVIMLRARHRSSRWRDLRYWR